MRWISDRVRSLWGAALAGLVMSVLLAVIMVALLPRSRALAVWLAPGLFVEPLLRAMVPDFAVRWLVPEGGPAAGLGLVLIGAILAWSVLLGSIFGTGRAWSRGRRRRSGPP